MKQHIITKSIAGLIAVVGILAGASKAEASLTGTLNGVNLFAPVVGTNPESATYNFTGPTGFNGTGIQLAGGSVSSVIAGGQAQLFDVTLTLTNTTASTQTLTFHFDESSTTLTNASPGLVLATSAASGTNPTPLVPATLTAFKSTVNGTSITNVGAGFDPGGVAGPLTYTLSNSVSKNVLVPVGAFDISQDFTIQMAAGASFNISNSLSVPTPSPVVTAVPEPGSLLTGASLLGLIGGSQLLRRKRNRESAC